MTECWIVISSLTQSVQRDLNGPPDWSLQIFLPIDELLIPIRLLRLTKFQRTKRVFGEIIISDYFRLNDSSELQYFSQQNLSQILSLELGKEFAI